jgi:hypothetical protein
MLYSSQRANRRGNHRVHTSGKVFAIFRGMAHSCQYLCSELVTVTYEEQPGEIRQATANLEEISTTCAVVLLEEKPKLGASISLAVKDRDLFGVIKAALYDAALGWFVIVALDTASLWRREWFSPKHLLEICGCSLEQAMQTKAQALENTRVTEENVPVNFVALQA